MGGEWYRRCLGRRRGSALAARGVREEDATEGLGEGVRMTLDGLGRGVGVTPLHAYELLLGGFGLL